MEINKNLFSNEKSNLNKTVLGGMLAGSVVGGLAGYKIGDEIGDNIREKIITEKLNNEEIPQKTLESISKELEKEGIVWDKDLFKEGQVGTTGQSLLDEESTKVYLWTKEENPTVHKKTHEVISKYLNINTIKYAVVGTVSGAIIGGLVGGLVATVVHKLTSKPG